MTFQKGQSGNPAGRKVGAVNKCVKVKDDFFKAYYKLGGLKNLLTLFDDKRVCNLCGKEFTLDDPLLQCDNPDCNGRIRFQRGKNTEREFFFRVLPQLMPKKVDLEGDLKVDTNITLNEEETELYREIKERLANPNRDK